MRQQQTDGHEFFKAWLQRSQMRRFRWQTTEQKVMDATHSELDLKIQLLRRKIADLAEQDTQLFQQFFALEDSIEELKTQMQSDDFYDYYDSDDDFSSITSSACSIASVHEVVKPASADADEETDDVFVAWTPQVEGSGPFVRQRVSFPPVSRNRCRRSQTVTTCLSSGRPDDDVARVLEICIPDDEKVTLRRPHSLSTPHSSQHQVLRSDGGESTASSLDSGIGLQPNDSNLHRNRRPNAREIFV